MTENQLILDEQTCWDAVVNRDSQFDGVFVTAVRSTGIYCRPSCPARAPKRENVTFFNNPDAAELSGYRACKRCHPRQIDPQVALVTQACRYIDSHLDCAPTLNDIGGVPIICNGCSSAC